MNRSFTMRDSNRSFISRKTSNTRNGGSGGALRGSKHDSITYSPVSTNNQADNGNIIYRDECWQARMAATYANSDIPVTGETTTMTTDASGAGPSSTRRTTNYERTFSRNSSVLSRGGSPNSSHKSSSNNNNYSQLISKRKQTIMICFVSLAFFICQLPIKVFQMFNTFYEWQPAANQEVASRRFFVLNMIFLCTKLLYFLHGMSNPIIYNLMSTKFNESFRNVILCKSLDYSIATTHKHKKKDPVLTVKI